MVSGTPASNAYSQSRLLKLRIFAGSRVCPRVRYVQEYLCSNGVSLLVQVAMGRGVSGS